jgi:hypothetical protein
MANLASIAITTAATNAVTAAKRFRRQSYDLPRSILCQGNFIYGSGGTSGTFWVQTSIDGGLSWCDVFAFGVLLANLRQAMNVVAITPKLTTASIAITDGSLAANTAIDALVGELWRVKYTTVGTYAATTMSIDLAPGSMVSGINE